MSGNNIDERIVKMQFDNAQFERGVQTSVKSLNNLKKGLDLNGSAKGLNDLSRAGRSFSLGGMADGIQAVAGKFSALGIMGVTTLVNLTNSAVNYGKRMASALTIDPIKTGLQEYETKMNAIQTILTNTQDKGTTLTDVNTALADLNEYADKTIYNFAEMTRNIGTFTAAGIDLKTSTQAIKGIANLAAGSGSNAQQASTAMYQLSQAMASGTVKLMDWNSVVNAGMGGQFFQKALEKTAEELGHGRDMSVSFRESLESGWITTEVLTKTLQKFAADPSLIQAATQVKTFTQLWDTMKESVQSGWSVSWENIIGNKDEAAKTLTAINDAFGSIAGKAADARNEMLSFWKANGGRDALIKSFANTFKFLGQVIKPIKEAMDEVFPPMTGKRLVELTKSLLKFTESLKIGDTEAQQIKTTFKGLFSFVSMIGRFLLTAGKGIVSFGKYIFSADSGLLAFVSSIGKFLTSLDETTKRTDAFNNALKKIQNFLKPVGDGVKKTFSTIANAFESLKNIDFSNLDNFLSTIKNKMSSFGKSEGFISKAMSKISGVIQKVTPLFNKLKEVIVKTFENFDLNKLVQIFNLGTLTLIFVAIKNIVKSFQEVSNDAGGFLKSITALPKGLNGVLSGITEVLNGTKGALVAWQKDIQANTLLKIAGAIAILAGAVLIMSFIDSTKLTGVLTAITVLFTELFGSMKIFDKIAGSSGFKNMGVVTRAMIALSIAILILSVAVTKLASLDWPGLEKGLIGVTVLIGGLIVASKLINKESKGMVKAGVALIVFATAIRVLVSSVVALGKMSLADLSKGLLGLVAVFALITAFVKLTDMGEEGAKAAAGILLLSIGIRILASAIKSMGGLDAGVLAQGILALTVILAELALFIWLVDENQMSKIGASLIGVSIAILIFTKSIQTMGQMPFMELLKGLIGLAVALGAITLAVNFMPKNMVGIGIGMIAMSAGLLLMAKALSIMGGMSWNDLAKGLVGMSIALLVLVVAVNAMSGAILGAVALTIITAGLIGLAFALKIIGSLSIGQLAIALGAIAATLLILGLAAAAMTPILPSMLLLGAALIVMGIGLAAVGAAAIVLAIGFAAIATAGLAGLGVLLAISIGLMPIVLLAPGIIAVGLALIGLSIGVLTLGFGLSILAAGLTSLIVLGPSGVETLKSLVNLAAAVSAFAAPLFLAGAGLLLFGAGAILAGIGSVIAGAGLILLANGLAKLAEIDITNMQSLQGISGDLLKASLSLLAASPGLLAGGAALVVFGSGAATTGEGLAKINSGIVDTVNSVKAAGKEITAAGQEVINAVKSIIEQVCQAIVDQKSKIEESTRTVINLALSVINDRYSSFYSSGTNMVDGFVSGIRARIANAAEAAAAMARASLAAANAELDIHSPSGKFEDVGMFANKGLANGLLNYSKLSENAASTVAKNTLAPVQQMASNPVTIDYKDAWLQRSTKKSSSMAQSLQAVVQNRSQISQLVDAVNSFGSTGPNDLTGTLTIQVTNDKGEIIGIAQKAIKDLLRKESR